ncbi:Putative ras-like guanine nucleotide exchange factor, small GTPase [Septoria linicola]|uniref:Ras-like guanine nucleotide exchange factor, small GTPase n=1 Tax=Septoria linicola TaxID=215465 RepID=A0A9Q9AIM9_9PEZI|nr:putative ras-like guanine nucleotide exchange factor, small GTPase [Septoria linicola]USW47140.1 Putative ras-like guanine nucleotide exchange factor, small GTPase [Septoria linicola]
MHSSSQQRLRSDHNDTQRVERRLAKSRSSSYGQQHRGSKNSSRVYPHQHQHHDGNDGGAGPSDGYDKEPGHVGLRQASSKTRSTPSLGLLVDQSAVVLTDRLAFPPAAAHNNHDTNEPDSDSAQDEEDDELAGVIGSVRAYQPFLHPEQHLGPLTPDINIAVIAAAGVGKSTFIKAALDLSTSPVSRAAERRVPYEGSTYLLRLLELDLEDIHTNNDGTIDWPDTFEDSIMPKVDGVLALYSCDEARSIKDLRNVLKAVTKSSLPTVLVATKCDLPTSSRAVNPGTVERNASRINKNIATLQVSIQNPDGTKRGISMLMNAIVHAPPEQPSGLRRATSLRRRAHSSSLGPISPRSSTAGHSRASSEYTVTKDPRQARVDSNFPTYSAGERLRVPRDDEPMHGSFLLEESASDPSATSSRSSISTDALSVVPGASPTTALTENGATFDELVDRLLDQPTSKADLRFASIFLALYRKFAAPGKLLEAIVQRFDTLEQNGAPMMMKSTTQLRYLAVIEKWVTTYPGDFAFSRTRRRLQTFAHKISDTRIFTAAAKEVTLAMDSVNDDDDTEWAYNDKDREASGEHSRSSMASTASTLIDDPNFTFNTELSGTTLSCDSEIYNGPKISNQMIAYVEQAQRYARELQPIQRNTLTKMQWRALMDQPDELIARELTRIDWIMFSSIRPRDLVRHVSLSKEQKQSCRNLAHVERMVEHFNQIACWVANYVLLRDKPKHRVLMLEKFMRVARKLRELNNYNSLGAVIAGVKSTSVHRLAATRDLVQPSVGKDWLKLEILMAPSRSHFAYRLAWENSSSERIPYLPLHRRDLATAEEGNKTFLGDDGRINWKKFEIMGDVIVSLQRAQGMPYKNLGGLQGNQQVKELLLDVKLLKDEDELYERSTQIEPPANTNIGPSAKFKQFFQR